MPLIPAAAVSESLYGKEHILYCRRIILYRKAFVAIGIYPLREHTYNRRGGIGKEEPTAEVVVTKDGSIEAAGNVV